MMTLFIFGSNIIVGIGTEANQDSWISLLLATVMVMPIILMYARIVKLNPEKSLFDIIERLFGKIIGKIFIILMTWYAIHLGSLVICNFTKFMKLSALNNTPEIMTTLILLFATIYIVRSPISSFGKWCNIVLTTIILTVTMTIIIGVPNMHFNHITPIMSHSFNDILSGAIKNFSFPFAETVIFLFLGCYIRKKDNPYKIYFLSLFLGSFIILVVFLRNIAILGSNVLVTSYFPSYLAVRLIQIGDFFSRIEGLIMINFILAGITKIVVCFIVAAKGIAKIFNNNDYKSLSVPVGLILLLLCTILYDSTIEMYNFLDVYTIYAIPFQIIIPFIVWIASEIESMKNKKEFKVKKT